MSPTETNPEQAAAEKPGDHDHAHTRHTHAPSVNEPKMNEQCKREVAIEVPAKEVQQAIDKALRKFQKLARIPGFRAGKVPAGIIKGRYMDDVRSEVVEALVPRYFQAEVERQGLSPVSQPQISDLHFEEGQPLRFKATFEVLPPFEVSGYKGLKAEKKDLSVSDAEVEEALRHLQERQASFEAVDDRPLGDGDFAQISFTGTAGGSTGGALKNDRPAGDAEVSEAAKPAALKAAKAGQPQAAATKPVEMQDVLVEIGGVNTVKEFTDHLRGAMPGEERSFEVTYAEDFKDQRLAGQTMSYQVNIQGVKKKTMPEVNDDFAKELGEFATLDALKTRLRENMEAERQHEQLHTEKEKLIDQLVEKNDIPVPQALLDRQIDVRLDRGFRALASQGMRMQDMRKMNLERLREGQREAALREVKASLLLDKIAEVEKIEASDEELERELEGAARETKQSVESLRARLTREGSLERIRDRIRNEKALEFLYQQSA